MPENKSPKITFKLTRIEDLSSSEISKVEGLEEGEISGLVIKEYASGSFVALKRFIPLNGLFTAQIDSELDEYSRKK